MDYAVLNLMEVKIRWFYCSHFKGLSYLRRTKSGHCDGYKINFCSVEWGIAIEWVKFPPYHWWSVHSVLIHIFRFDKRLYCCYVGEEANLLLWWRKSRKSHRIYWLGILLPLWQFIYVGLPNIAIVCRCKKEGGEFGRDETIDIGSIGMNSSKVNTTIVKKQVSKLIRVRIVSPCW